MNTKADFLASLARSTEVVKSWPSWKQTVWAPNTPSLPAAPVPGEVKQQDLIPAQK